MAKITFGENEHTLAPFKFREIRAAAPYIDRVLARRRDMNAREGETVDEAVARLSNSEQMLETMTDSLGDILAVVAIGLIKDRREFPYTPAKIAAVVEEIEADASMEEINGLNPVFDAILQEAGMVRSTTPLERGSDEEAPLLSGSTESSQNSSQPVAAAETGNE